ncbi:MAG: HisA/HisF-related TIM barrel protein [Pseudolabrys sp.]
MLIPRVIPCLLVMEGAMVKTRRFRKPSYIGDPLNVISLFNGFEVDEIVLLDIRASVNGTPPDFGLIQELAEHCWVPLTYGGGIRSLDMIEKIILSGVEKVVLNSVLADNLAFASDAAREFGSSAVVAAVDAQKRRFGGYDVVVESGRRRLNVVPAMRARQLADAGVGEIFLNAVDRDGERSGFDLPLIGEVTCAVDVPVVACGGAGSRAEIADPILKAGASATAAGSLFVQQGESRAVLVNFPERRELESILIGH